MLYRIIPGLVAALLATTAISWLFDPTAAAAGLGMPYLEGIGRSTQVGDFSAFFVFLGCHVYRRRHYTNWPLPAQRLLAAAGCGFPHSGVGIARRRVGNDVYCCGTGDGWIVVFQRLQNRPASQR